MQNDVLECQLKPVDTRDYRVAFTDEERARLAEIFPGGVCDWTRPGVDSRNLRARGSLTERAGSKSD
jgi:hypothetical protein